MSEEELFAVEVSDEVDETNKKETISQQKEERLQKLVININGEIVPI